MEEEGSFRRRGRGNGRERIGEGSEKGRAVKEREGKKGWG